MPFYRPSINHLRRMSNILRTNDWIVYLSLPVPRAVSDLEFFKDKSILNFSMLAHQVSFPQVQSSLQEVSISGFKIRVPVDTDYPGTVTITFHETTDLKATYALWEWQKAIEHPNTKVKDDDYKGKMIITLTSPISKEPPNYPLPKDEKVDVTAPLVVTLWGVAIAGIQFPDLTSDKQGDLFRPTATFSYDWADFEYSPGRLQFSP